ncbi:hypothetical protein PTSG_13170 [Salpingoeca rosetta]|uniref:Uncharacterized protein n=1 Tax=Salpingoeca rosetta (strain ATCC 50818 / BSB-021) TaxID=946362 RepID=F2UT21_SALR5|nr:uncharacterized protein PTSG_13170 [Salpingoeca rosetta]EGD81280.1 hypothetical protein PTSG_13170 [Salpingoeca rosetta]|eukprot:XP_004987676.1 hypothetical protein PTSG_13170 [Salpingoeca rosetta]
MEGEPKKKQYNTLLARRRAEIGRVHTPENPQVHDMVHGVTSKAIDAQVAKREDAVVRKRRPPGSHVGYDPLPTPQLGRRTRSMQQNVLLQKNELGKSSSTGTRQMQEMVHGVKTHKVDTAEQAMNTWRSHSYSKSLHAAKARPQLDYMEMNKRALTRGLVTPREQLSMRQSEVVYRKQRLPQAPKGHDNSHARHMLHGKPSGQSVSVAELMTSRPGDQWLAQRHAEQEREREHARITRKQGYGMTRAAVLRTKRPEAPAQPPWTMKKFQNAQPTLQTFRVPAPIARRLACHRAHHAGIRVGDRPVLLDHHVQARQHRARSWPAATLPATPLLRQW